MQDLVVQRGTHDPGHRAGDRVRALRRVRRPERQQGLEQGRPALATRRLGGAHPDDRAGCSRSSAQRLTGDGALIVTSTLTRDQIKNREDALSKLALIVRAALIRPKRRRRPSVARRQATPGRRQAPSRPRSSATGAVTNSTLARDEGLDRVGVLRARWSACSAVTSTGGGPYVAVTDIAHEYNVATREHLVACHEIPD